MTVKSESGGEPTRLPPIAPTERPCEHVVGKDLRAGYAAMAADETGEREARDWAEGLVADVADEPRRHG
jgi:hypothetical protein